MYKGNEEFEENGISGSLSHVIRGSLVSFYNQELTPELIDKLCNLLTESIYLYLIKRKA